MPSEADVHLWIGIVGIIWHRQVGPVRYKSFHLPNQDKTKPMLLMRRHAFGKIHSAGFDGQMEAQIHHIIMYQPSQRHRMVSDCLALLSDVVKFWWVSGQRPKSYRMRRNSVHSSVRPSIRPSKGGPRVCLRSSPGASQGPAHDVCRPAQGPMTVGTIILVTKL